MYELILHRRLVRYLEERGKLHASQAGFREDMGCLDQIYILHEVTALRMAKGETTHVAFVDIKKAFPSVSHDVLMEKLSEMGVTDRMWKAVMSLLTGNTTRIKGVGSTPGRHKIAHERGTREGSVMSPLLFLIMVNDLLKTGTRVCAPHGCARSGAERAGREGGEGAER